MMSAVTRTDIDPASDLFAAEALPPGLSYRPDFISPEEETGLLRHIADLALAPAPYKGFTALRRTASYGAAYDFDAQRLNSAPDLPDFLVGLRARVADTLGVPPERLAQALVTEYRTGTPLGWHRDTPEFDLIGGVSLAGDCEMRWRRYPPQPRPAVLSLRVARRSLYLISGEARSGWQHSVAPTRALRYSITFRTLRLRRPGDASPQPPQSA
jgi:alkylated DNA repair dioxygenase AlkB